MADVVGIDRKPIESNSQALRSADAKVALRALLEKVESGETKLYRWFFIFEELNPENEGQSSLDFMDSDLTIESAVYLLERMKDYILRRLFP